MGLANPCYLPPPGVNAWARERSSFKLGDYSRFGRLDKSSGKMSALASRSTEGEGFPMIKKILLGGLIIVVVIVVVFVCIVALQPSHYHIERSATINAPASVVFGQVNDFHKWEAWSPWAKIDPAMKQSYEGAPAGAGAIYSWSGNSQVGEGRMTIVESNLGDLSKIKLEF